MALSDDFADAQVRVKQLTKMPSTDELLELYALYKQATSGDASGKRPGLFDMKARAKYDAWATKKSIGRDDAMKSYVSLVGKLTGKYR